MGWYTAYLSLAAGFKITATTCQVQSKHTGK